MREYKFRGKRKDNDEWVYGCYFYDGKTHYILTGLWIEIDDGSGNELPDFYEVDPETVEQYTGTKDKNGKEAFTDDILETPAGKAVIKFGEYSQPTGGDNYHIGFYLEFEHEEIDILRKDIGYWLPKSTVIGNIHDNPELLEVQMYRRF
jgi:uncharacterized phage protein (TIGR01671 family)